jgi:antitoxin component of MazEF toxin-antitoxin module
MQIVKIRRVGNSNVISLPKEFEKSGFVPGTSVAVDETPTGELVIMPASRLQRDFREIIRQVVAEDREALDMLARYDRGEIVNPST